QDLDDKVAGSNCVRTIVGAIAGGCW
ncbi:hypothetical protein A2U01_0049427, partial [Trifolium medium]|nr:hypothetical protein [Trifolium medium]